MNIYKKQFLLLCLLSFVACSSGDPEPTPPTTEVLNDTSTVTTDPTHVKVRPPEPELEPPKEPEETPIKPPPQAPLKPLSTQDEPDPSPTPPPENGERRLLTPDDLEFLGAFRLPSEGSGETHFRFGGYSMTLNPRGDPNGEADGFPGSLYVVGNRQQYVAEISIPAPLMIDAVGLAGLNIATILQPFADITGGLKAALDEGLGARVGGLEWFERNGEEQIFWTAFEYYNVSGDSDLSHGVSSTNLAQPNARGLWRLGNFHSQMTAGYIFSVPEYFADVYLEGKRLISGLNIAQGASYSSAGPAMFAYAPWQDFPEGSPPAGAVLDVIPLVYYTRVQPEDSNFPDHQIPDWWHGGVWVDTENAHGVLITGRRAMGPTFYGVGREEDCSPHQGYHGDPYEPRILFYSPVELTEAAQEERIPQEVLPYIEWNPSGFVFSSCEGLLSGAAYDRENRLLYILHRNANTLEREPTPLIYIFQVH